MKMMVKHVVLFLLMVAAASARVGTAQAGSVPAGVSMRRVESTITGVSRRSPTSQIVVDTLHGRFFAVAGPQIVLTDEASGRRVFVGGNVRLENALLSNVGKNVTLTTLPQGRSAVVVGCDAKDGPSFAVPLEFPE